MTDRTPTTLDVRGKYATHQGARYRGRKHLDLRRAEFDRWLDRVRAVAWDEGYFAGLVERGFRTGRREINPYGEETDA